MKNFQNTLYINDNLYVLLGLDSESVDLIYLDPPFNSKRIYSAPVGSRAAGVSFKDMWTWKDVDEYNLDSLAVNNLDLTKFIASVGRIHSKAMMAYLTYMAQRIVEMHRILKNTGALYLHCDPTANHYLKIVLDAVFGKEQFRNEIIWKRANPKSHISRNFPTCNDTILRYTKTADYVYHQSYEEHNPEYVKSAYRHKDEKGLYRLLPLLNPNDNRPNLTYEFLGVTRVWRWTKERMKKAYEDGIVVQTKPGAVPQYKKYLNDSKGKTVTNCWTDIQQASGRESLGYPTQKPLALLNRIIKVSSNEGDIVLDPFCGCATTCVAAEYLDRKWIGIDIEDKATDILIQRLSLATGLLDHFVATDKLPARTDLKEMQPTEPVKQRLYKKQKGLCNACGKEFEIRNLEIDHIIPKSKGGGDYYENYQLLCGSCNRIKGDRPMEYLRAKIATIELTRGKIFFGE